MMMSEAKFTDGPWCIKEIEGDKEYIRVRGTRLGQKFKIANVIDLKTHHDESKWCKADRAESLANAHLIAAAPEMYDYLDGLYQNLCSIGDDSETVDEIRKLIAKARGEK
jgi:hypothetical protein